MISFLCFASKSAKRSVKKSHSTDTNKVNQIQFPHILKENIWSVAKTLFTWLHFIDCKNFLFPLIGEAREH